VPWGLISARDPCPSCLCPQLPVFSVLLLAITSGHPRQKINKDMSSPVYGVIPMGE